MNRVKRGDLGAELGLGVGGKQGKREPTATWGIPPRLVFSKPKAAMY